MKRKATSAARPKGQRQAVRDHGEKSNSDQHSGSQQRSSFGNGILTKKNYDYLSDIVKNTQADKAHPRHHGIAMQAHHIISETAVKNLPDGVRHNLEYFNYNINSLDNLVFLPYTLQGACHLGVQPHRGNHNVGIPSNEPIGEDDALYEETYHDKVLLQLLGLRPLVRNACAGECSKAELLKISAEVVQVLNQTSKSILRNIQNKPQFAPLTKLYEYFQPGMEVGCAGVDSVNGHGKNSASHGMHRCGVNRNHLRRQVDGQRSENISYDAAGAYKLQTKR